MNQNLFFLSPWILNLSILALSLLLANANGGVDPSYEACSRVARTTCGDNQTISFPFYVGGKQESFCGYPGFELSCSGNGHPILSLSNDHYILRQISYQNQSFQISNAAFSNPNQSCIPRLRNLTLPSEELELPKQKQVFLIYNCQQPPRVPEYEIGCSSENESNWVVGVYGNDRDRDRVGRLSTKCGNATAVVVAPVKEEYGSGIREAVSRGLELKWKLSFDCGRCEKTGGICGFNTSINLYQCYCKDRPHRVRCHYHSGLSLSSLLSFYIHNFFIRGFFSFFLFRICPRQNESNTYPN